MRFEVETIFKSIVIDWQLHFMQNYKLLQLFEFIHILAIHLKLMFCSLTITLTPFYCFVQSTLHKRILNDQNIVPKICFNEKNASKTNEYIPVVHEIFFMSHPTLVQTKCRLFAIKLQWLTEWNERNGMEYENNNLIVQPNSMIVCDSDISNEI